MRTRHADVPAKLAALSREVKARERPDLSRYQQLSAALLAIIRKGHWKPGDRLPTESSLARTLPFSLGTVQRAFRALVDEGVVTRVQGSGTFVATAHDRIDDVAHCRFLGDDGASTLPVFSRVLSRTNVKRRGSWTRWFTGAEAALVRVDRILSVNREFDVYNRFYFDSRRFGDLASRPLAELAGANFKELLRRELNVPQFHVAESLQLCSVPWLIASKIGLAEDATGALMEVVARSSGELTLYYQEMFIPPSPRKLALQSA